MGTMFTVFFTNQSVARLADVNACDLDMFKTYFHFMKDHGILLRHRNTKQILCLLSIQMN